MKQLTLTLFAAALFVARGAAQQAADTLSQVVISVSKVPESRRNVPNQVRTISPKEVASANAANAADLLTSTGEVFVQKSQQGGGSPVLRGLESNRILLTLDGVRMNNAIYRGGHLQNVLRIDQFSLDRAEVTGGPGSLVYGSDALGGVISFFTKKPAFSTGSDGSRVRSGSVAARYGTAAEEKTAHADYAVGGRTWASYTSASFSDFGDLRQGAGRDSKYPGFGERLFEQKIINGQDSMVANSDPDVQLGSAYWQANFLQKLRFQKKENVEHGLTFLFTTTGDVPRYDRLSEVRANGLPRSAEWYYGPERWFLGSYQLKFRPDDRRAADMGSLTAAYQRIKESRHTRSWGSQNRKDQVEKVHVVTVNGDFEKAAGDQTFRYGFEVAGNSVRSEATFYDIATKDETEADTRYPDGGSSTFGASAYATDRWRMTDRWVLNFGARYNYAGLSASFVNRVVPFPFNSVQQNNGALSGNLGLVFLPSNSLKISVLGSTGYRVPNIDDMGKVFESVTGAQLIVPNADLAPEYAWNGELTVETLGNGRLQAALTGYATRLTDIHGLAPTTFDGQSSVIYFGDTTPVFSTQNVGTGRILGVTGRASARLTGWLALNATASWAQGRLIGDDDKETPLDHIPPVIGRVGLAAGQGKWSAEVFGIFNGKKPLDEYRLGAEDNERYATAEGTLAWWTLNLRASYLLMKNMEAQVAVENILDKNYRPFASGLSGAGRDFRLTLRYGF